MGALAAYLICHKASEVGDRCSSLPPPCLGNTKEPTLLVVVKTRETRGADQPCNYPGLGKDEVLAYPNIHHKCDILEHKRGAGAVLYTQVMG